MIDINIYPAYKQFEPLIKLFPPVQANKFLPEWYKNQKSTLTKEYMQTNKTDSKYAKDCPAIQELITDGIIIPAWSDVYIYKWEGKLHWRVPLGDLTGSGKNEDEPLIEEHFIKQAQGMELNLAKDVGVLKLVSPYNIVTPDGYGVEVSDPFYHHRRNIKVLPGKVETDIWHYMQFPFEFYSKDVDYKKEVAVIKAGEPLLMINAYKKDNETNLILNNFDKDIHKKQFENTVLKCSLSHDFKRYRKEKS